MKNLNKCKILKIKSQIQENEIEFDEDVIIQNNEINAYISTGYIDLTEKFGLKYKYDWYYDMYFDYNYLTKKSYITIIQKNSIRNKCYKYIPTKEEEDIILSKLRKYITKREHQTMEQLIKEAEEYEEESQF